MTNEFIPVILGIDVGAYSVARTIYEHYKIKSIVIGKYTYWMTKMSKITKVLTVEDMNEEKLVNFLIELKELYPDKKLLLFGCSEDYVEIMIKNKEKLEPHYIIPTIDYETLLRVSSKETFYEICEKAGINYPKTIVINKNNYQDIKIPFKYPIIAKASNKAEYQRVEFEGKQKVFTFNNKEEYINSLRECFKSGYNDTFVIQEFVKGPDSNMRVLTCFANKESQVIFSSAGQVLLEEKGPNVTGNYCAIYNIEDKKIVEAAKKFIKETNYVGYANFDIKYDEETKKYYFFEVNVRLGRSNFYMGAANTNYLEPLIDTYIYEKPKKEYHQNGEELYSIIPMYIIRKYCKDKELVCKVKKLKRNNPLDYKKDFSLQRKYYIEGAKINHIRKFRKYYE